MSAQSAKKGMNFDAFGNIFFSTALTFGGHFDQPVTRGTVVTVTMDTGDNFDRWLRGNTGDRCHGHGEHLWLLPWIRGNICDCCHGYGGGHCDCCHGYVGTVVTVAMDTQISK